MSDQTCRHCGVPIVWLESIAQWWHMVAGSAWLVPASVNATHTYRGCRDKSGKLTGRGHAEPEEKGGE